MSRPNASPPTPGPTRVPVVALAGPAVCDATVRAIRDAGMLAITIDRTRKADLHTLEPGSCAVVLQEITVLGCDLLLLEIPADTGLDPASIELWTRVRLSGMPAVVAVSGLGPNYADFDDMCAIVRRVLEPEAVVAALPVFDDDEHPVAIWDVLTEELIVDGSRGPGEPVHAELSRPAREELCQAIAVHCSDDELAATLLAGLDDAPGTPNLPAKAVAQALGAAVTAGQLVPVFPAVGRQWSLQLAEWLAITEPTIRLARRTVDGEASGSDAAVVLAADGEKVLLRAVYGTLTPGPAVMTAPGCDSDGAAVPYRAWPNEISDCAPSESVPVWCQTVVRAQPGDALGPEPVWLLPIHTG